MSDRLRKIVDKYFNSFSYFYSKLGYRIFIAIILSLAIGILDGFGLSMFLPLLQMINGEESVNSEAMGSLRFIVDALESSGLKLDLLVVLIVMMVFFTFKGGAKFLSFSYRVVLQQFFIRKIRLQMVKALNAMTFKSFVNSDVGQIQNTLSGEVDRVAKAFVAYFATMQQFILMSVYMSFAFLIDWPFAALVTLGGILTNLIYKIIYKRTKSASKTLTLDSHKLQGLIIQHVTNFKYLKATGLLPSYAKKLLQSILAIEYSNKRMGIYDAILQSAREPLMILVVSSVILIQSSFLGASLGPILISLLFFYRALDALMAMQSRWNVFLATSGSMNNMTEFQGDLASKEEKVGIQKLALFKGEIALQEASFSYKDRQVLKEVDLCIMPNETVAFIGESGSGKTTLVNILAGLIPIDTGKMTIDGIDRNELDLSSYQCHIGYITQDPVIFNDTVYNNITFWEDPTDRNMKKFKKILKMAFLDDFIEQLPEEEKTELGNNGINLSGGQKQRIAIARELFKEASILILDEATSALDSETERIIQDNLDNLKGSHTILIVAHRLSTIRNADRVVHMKEGRIIEIGKFDQLIKSSAEIKRMVDLQSMTI